MTKCNRCHRSINKIGGRADDLVVCPYCLTMQKVGEKVAVAGAFDPLHIGHVRHIQKAAALGGYLVAIVGPDEFLIKKKGYVFMPLTERMEIVGALKGVDEVVEAIDKDGTCAETLRKIQPQIFAKGGDRDENTMPIAELMVCKDIGCKVVYGIGEKLGSSTELVSSFGQAVKDDIQLLSDFAGTEDLVVENYRELLEVQCRLKALGIIK